LLHLQDVPATVIGLITALGAWKVSQKLTEK
jgi:hypothetical protein